LSKIINGGQSDRHLIKPYRFKELEDSSGVNEFESFSTFKENIQTETPSDSQEAENEKNDKVIETLLQKIEELSNNIIKSQMEFEKQIKECHENSALKVKEAFDEGYQKGLNEATQKCAKEIDETKKFYEDSIKKLEQISEIFNKKLDSIEKELISVALDIANEVIQKELSENSKEVALSLAKSLMQDLKDASTVKVKVNPKDAEYLKDNIKGVEIIPDEAVKVGGVVIMSDIGNIDGEIEERFQAVKEAVLNK